MDYDLSLSKGGRFSRGNQLVLGCTDECIEPAAACLDTDMGLTCRGFQEFLTLLLKDDPTPRCTHAYFDSAMLFLLTIHMCRFLVQERSGSATTCPSTNIGNSRAYFVLRMTTQLITSPLQYVISLLLHLSRSCAMMTTIPEFAGRRMAH